MLYIGILIIFIASIINNIICMQGPLSKSLNIEEHRELELEEQIDPSLKLKRFFSDQDLRSYYSLRNHTMESEMKRQKSKELLLKKNDRKHGSNYIEKLYFNETT